MKSIETNVGIVHSFIESFWNAGNMEMVEHMLTEDYVDHAYIPGNREGLLNTAQVLHTAFPDQRSDVKQMIAQDDRVVVRLTMRGTHQGTFRGTEATHNPIEVNLYREYRLVDGKIAEHWALFDTAALLRQIGAELNEHNACKIKKD
ncbi:ester cyclase [Paenibacillus sedimenti]|uniref:Ester cyclase n=1 Tax=Paenibacillus sedimenti TaxID=2770274 RepID=A0A926KKE3_9BACL|nr:ester cyclase [Paenibacillus sedimenti]MBD0379412.1 ester cyclase [Paenibacillus sedimenti]